jgi:hypothetical protein
MDLYPRPNHLKAFTILSWSVRDLAPFAPTNSYWDKGGTPSAEVLIWYRDTVA